jgi:hypothetical protein
MIITVDKRETPNPLSRETFSNNKKVNSPDKKQPQSMALQVKEIIKETMLDSTGHGFPNLISNKRWSFRIMWLLCMLGAFCGCAYLLTKSIKDFLEFEVVTSIRKVGETPALFPTVTLCNTNMIVNQVSQSYVSSMLSQDSSLLAASVYKYTYMKVFFGALLSSPSLNDSFRQSTGSTFNQLIIKCWFNTADCDRSNWVWYFDAFYGNCFRFNSGVDSNGNQVADLVSTKNGKINGLSIL